MKRNFSAAATFVAAEVLRLARLPIGLIKSAALSPIPPVLLPWRFSLQITPIESGGLNVRLSAKKRSLLIFVDELTCVFSKKSNGQVFDADPSLRDLAKLVAQNKSNPI